MMFEVRHEIGLEVGMRKVRWSLKDEHVESYSVTNTLGGRYCLREA